MLRPFSLPTDNNYVDLTGGEPYAPLLSPVSADESDDVQATAADPAQVVPNGVFEDAMAVLFEDGQVGILPRCYERVVEVHVHLAEERMEPVIHRCHRCIGGEVGADSSNHLSSNEQVCVGKIEVGISCSRYHEFYWTPPSREMSKVGVLSNRLLRYWSASVARRKGLVHSSPPHTIVGVRTPYYENTSVRCRRLMGVTRR